jgi:hypothetical protein
MLRACEEARLVVQRGRDAFDGDVLVRRAAERTIEILVAAGNSIRDELTELDPDYPWPGDVRYAEPDRARALAC